MATGIVKWFDDAKGYGFIAPDDDTAAVFVPNSVLKASGYKSLEEGQKVKFESIESVRGPNAKELVVV